jgi:hypothetical protein
MIKSPCNLEVLLHCYYSPELHPRFDTPAVQAALKYLRESGMITVSSHPDSGDIIKTTDKGIFYIHYLMEIPFPEVQWIIPPIE